jgi:hypothetical protein
VPAVFDTMSNFEPGYASRSSRNLSLTDQSAEIHSRTGLMHLVGWVYLIAVRHGKAVVLVKHDCTNIRHRSLLIADIGCKSGSKRQGQVRESRNGVMWETEGWIAEESEGEEGAGDVEPGGHL